MTEGNSRLPEIEKRYILGYFGVGMLVFLFLYVISGGGGALTSDWVRIYTFLVVISAILVGLGLSTGRTVADFHFFARRESIYELGIIKLSDFDLDIIFGILIGISLSIGTLFILGIGFSIAPETLATGGATTQFTTEFIAPVFEEAFIAGILIPTLILWFRKIGFGFILLAVGTIMTFILLPNSTSSLNPIGIFIIVIALLFIFIRRLNKIIIKNKYIATLSAVILAAAFFAGLHGYSLSNNPNFNSSNIWVGYITIFSMGVLFQIINRIRNAIIFSEIAHATYNGIIYIIQKAPITSFTIALGIIILITLIIFNKIRHNPNFFVTMVSKSPTI